MVTTSLGLLFCSLLLYREKEKRWSVIAVIDIAATSTSTCERIELARATCMVATSLGHTMFGSRTTDPAKLPPCKDARDQHINRANYQAAIWRHSLAARSPVPSRQGNGWTVDGHILVDWTDSPAAPQAVLECVSCKCKKYTGARCSCKLNRLTCTGG